MTPFGPDDLDPAGDELSPEDEAGVRAILASLPDPPLPDDVRERITAALRAEDIAAAGTGARTVTPLGPRRSHRAPTRRTPRLLQAAAAVAVLAVGGAAVVAVVGQGDDGTPTGGPGTVVAAAPTPGPITSSGTDYTAENVPTLVGTLLAGGNPAATAPTPTPTPGGLVAQSAPGGAAADSGASADSETSADSLASAGSTTKKKKKKKNQDSAASATSAGPEAMSEGGGSGGSGGGQSDDESSTGSDTASDAAAVTALVQDPESRATCIAALSGATGTVALSIDVGTYEGRPAAVFVLPDQVNPTRADVWVVGPTCSDADNPFPYSYYSVPLP